MAIPLLVEGGRATAWTASWSSTWTKTVQLQRVMERDGSSLEQARAILAAQASRAHAA
jgi:dephospho-CoA kinase